MTLIGKTGERRHPVGRRREGAIVKKIVAATLMLVGACLLLGLVIVLWLVTFNVLPDPSYDSAFGAIFLTLVLGAFSVVGGGFLWAESE
jgi:hypothetical protein